MPKCGCAGQTCGCRITAGAGTVVTGSGTAKDPFVVAFAPSSLNLGGSIAVSTSNSIEFSKVGSGSLGDPVVISGAVVLRSPDNSRWSLSVSNAGVLTAVKL